MSVHLVDVGSAYFEKEDVQGSVIAPALVPAEDVFGGGGISIPFDMAELIEGEPELAPRTDMRKTRGKRKPDAIGPRVGGKKRMRRTATFSLTLRMEGVGDGDSDNYPLTWLLNTLLEDTGAPDNLTDDLLAFHDPAPGDSAADAFHFRPTNVDRFSEGDVIAAFVEGRPVFLWVTDVNAVDDYVRVLGAPRHLSEDDTIRFCRVFKATNLASRPTLRMRFDKEGYQAQCFGVRLTGLQFTVSPKGEGSVLRLQMNFSVRHMRYRHASAAIIQPTWPAGDELQFNGGDVTLSETLPAEGTAGPYQKARAGEAVAGVDGEGVLHTGELEVTVAGEYAEAPSHRSVLAGEDRVRDVGVSARIRLSQPETGFDEDLEDEGAERFFSMACGTVEAGNGFGVVIPVAHSTADAGARKEAEGVLVQDITIEDAIQRGTKTAAAADSSFYVAVML